MTNLKAQCARKGIKWCEYSNAPVRRAGLLSIIEIRGKDWGGGNLVDTKDVLTLKDAKGRDYIVYQRELYRVQKDEHASYIEIDLAKPKPVYKNRSRKYDG